MKKIFGIILGVLCWMNALIVCASEKFDILPDLPEPLAAAQASSVSTTGTNDVSSVLPHTIGQEPSFISVLFSLIFVILLIYATGIIYTKLNKVGAKTLKKQLGNTSGSKVSVISTTPLGSNKTLHVVELDGKRMLIGASTGAIQLIKDLGTFPPQEIEKCEFSNIEIPSIRIPKIEIPKIEFPNIGFTKTAANEPKDDVTDSNVTDGNDEEKNDDSFEISEIYEEGPDGIIDKLFQSGITREEDEQTTEKNDEHKVDPDEFALYKKYL